MNYFNLIQSNIRTSYMKFDTPVHMYQHILLSTNILYDVSYTSYTPFYNIVYGVINPSYVKIT